MEREGKRMKIEKTTKRKGNGREREWETRREEGGRKK